MNSTNFKDGFCDPVNRHSILDEEDEDWDLGVTVAVRRNEEEDLDEVDELLNMLSDDEKEKEEDKVA